MRIVAALGGNALLQRGQKPDADVQEANVARAVAALAPLADAHELVLTHGNGPQVGNLLVKNEIAAAVVPPVPLDWCGAQTQGTLGFILLDALEPALAAVGSAVRPAALVSRTLVDIDDPGFATPSRSSGRYSVTSTPRALMVVPSEAAIGCPVR